MSTADAAYAALSRPCWLDPFGSLDWTPCFRAVVLNGALPYAVLACSVVAWVSAVVVDKNKRREQFAREVAQLNPESSNFYQTFPESSETTPLAPQPTTAAERVLDRKSVV